MKSRILSLLMLGFLTLPGASRLYAANPSESPAKGKVLILKNEHTMEGDIERIGDRYRVRRVIGETWVRADQALRLVASSRDAYTYLRARANLEDADERLRLANWCHLNGLREQALAEIRAAVDLRPEHAETRRLLQHLQQTQPTPDKPKSAASGPIESATEPSSAVELTTDSLGQFATRVQPILMNTCARCHATGRGGKFHLTQAYEGGLVNRRTLERNLAAVLAEINLDQPASSRLLSKAVSDHAHLGQPPLKDRKDAPYRTLENWVKLTVANNPHLRDSLPAATGTRGRTPPAQPSRTESQSAADEARTQWGADARPALTAGTPLPPVPNTVAVPPPPSSPPGPADPYDPDLFNRQMHPETNKSDPGK